MIGEENKDKKEEGGCCTVTSEIHHVEESTKKRVEPSDTKSPVVLKPANIDNTALINKISVERKTNDKQYGHVEKKPRIVNDWEVMGDLEMERKERDMKIARKQRTAIEKSLGKPKRALSAYNFFVSEQKDEMKRLVSAEKGTEVGSNENPFVDRTKIVAQRWNKIKKDPEKMKKYQDLADADSVRYHREKERYKYRQEQCNKELERKAMEEYRRVEAEVNSLREHDFVQNERILRPSSMQFNSATSKIPNQYVQHDIRHPTEEECFYKRNTDNSYNGHISSFNNLGTIRRYNNHVSGGHMSTYNHASSQAPYIGHNYSYNQRSDGVSGLTEQMVSYNQGGSCYGHGGGGSQRHNQNFISGAGMYGPSDGRQYVGFNDNELQQMSRYQSGGMPHQSQIVPAHYLQSHHKNSSYDHVQTRNFITEGFVQRNESESKQVKDVQNSDQNSAVAGNQTTFTGDKCAGIQSQNNVQKSEFCN